MSRNVKYRLFLGTFLSHIVFYYTKINKKNMGYLGLGRFSHTILCRHSCQVKDPDKPSNAGRLSVFLIGLIVGA